MFTSYIVTADKKIPYTVNKSSRKTIAIKIEPNGNVKVSAPEFMNNHQIQIFINSKTNWILKKLRQLEQNRQKEISRDFVSGDRLMFLGREYLLTIIQVKDATEERVGINKDHLVVYVKWNLEEAERKSRGKQLLFEWYTGSMLSLLEEHVERYARRLKVFPKQIRIKDTKTRWGSASSKGNLNFNWRLIMAPVEVIDYVVVHELCHLMEMNHSKKFWMHVAQQMPEYEKYKKWLKDNGGKLVFY